MLKRIITGFMVSILIAIAVETSSYAFEPETISEAIMSTAFGLKETYELSVISRMAGRCGSATQTGAKGIAFEVIYTDVKNIENSLNAINKGLKTQFTKCPNAESIDLVTLDKAGNLVERIQCKDTPSASATTQVIEAVKTGKYKSAQLVGTTEAAEAFNEKAVSEGISKVMKDSGISTEATQYIADRALGNISSAEKILKSSCKSSLCGAAIAGGFAIADSCMEGDDIFETMGNVCAETVIGGLAEGVTTAIACTAAEALTAVGAGSATVTLTPLVISFCGTILILYILEGVADSTGIEEIIARYSQKGYEAVCDIVYELKMYASRLNIEEKMDVWEKRICFESKNIWEKTKNGAIEVWETSKEGTLGAYERIKFKALATYKGN